MDEGIVELFCRCRSRHVEFSIFLQFFHSVFFSSSHVPTRFRCRLLTSHLELYKMPNSSGRRSAIQCVSSPTCSTRARVNDDGMSHEFVKDCGRRRGEKKEKTGIFWFHMAVEWWSASDGWRRASEQAELKHKKRIRKLVWGSTFESHFSSHCSKHRTGNGKPKPLKLLQFQ